jgi:hypothetical protein
LFMQLHGVYSLNVYMLSMVQVEAHNFGLFLDNCSVLHPKNNYFYPTG